MTLSRELLVSWAAGFLDGEGCIGIYKFQAHMQFSLSTSQKDVRALNRLQDLFGGTIYRQTDTVSQWRLQSKGRAYDALKELLPLLVVKREQAELFLELHDLWFGRKVFSDPSLSAHILERAEELKRLKRR